MYVRLCVKLVFVAMARLFLSCWIVIAGRVCYMNELRNSNIFWDIIEIAMTGKVEATS